MLKAIQILVFCCLAPSIGVSQPVFEKEQVDVPAAPRGGDSVLDAFVKYNLRVPFMISVLKKSGQVEIRGVVEQDGSTSSLEVVRGLNKWADAEAIRVFEHFKAWAPARKNGETVRQAFSYRIDFEPEPLDHFNASAGEYDFFYDKALKKIADEREAKFRVQIPGTALGTPYGIYTISERSGKKWKPVHKAEVEMVQFKLLDQRRFAPDDTVEALYLGVNTYPLKTGLPVHIFSKDNKLLNTAISSDDNSYRYERKYYPEGQLREVFIEEPATPTTILCWYRSSLLQVSYTREKKDESTTIEKIETAFDTLGNLLVSEGNGWIRHFSNDWGEGKVENGYKVGTWIAIDRNGALLFEEHYDNGRLTGGKRYKDGRVFDYNKVHIPPEFRGGSNALYTFLARNIRYPKEAARFGTDGRVLVSFVVDEEGSVQNITLENKSDPVLEAEAVRVVKKSSGQWKNGLSRGVPVKVKYTLPLNFKLQSLY